MNNAVTFPFNLKIAKYIVYSSKVINTVISLSHVIAADADSLFNDIFPINQYNYTFCHSTVW